MREEKGGAKDGEGRRRDEGEVKEGRRRGEGEGKKTLERNQRSPRLAPIVRRGPTGSARGATDMAANFGRIAARG